MIRRIAAGLAMPDWPDGARRALTISIGPVVGIAAPILAPLESLLDRLREGEAMGYEGD